MTAVAGDLAWITSGELSDKECAERLLQELRARPRPVSATVAAPGSAAVGKSQRGARRREELPEGAVILPAGSAETTTPAEARGYVGECVEWAVEQALAGERASGDDGSPTGVVIAAGAGTGKTRALADALQRQTDKITVDIQKWGLKFKTPYLRQGSNIDIYLPDDRMVADFAALLDERDVPYRIFRGRGAVTTNGEAYCSRAALANKIGEMSEAVAGSICQRRDSQSGTWVKCPHHGRCPFTRQYLDANKDRRGIVRLFTHRALFLPRPTYPPMMLLPGRLVVIDESPQTAAEHKVKLPLARIAARMPANLTPALRALIGEVVMALEQAADPLQLASPADFERLADFFDGLTGCADVRPDMPDTEIAKLVEEADSRRARDVASFWRLLADEAQLARPLQRIVIRRADDEVMVHLFDRRQPRLADDVPVILLDASHNKLVNEKVLGRKLEVARARVPRAMVHIQVEDDMASRSSILGAGRGDKAPAARRQREIEELAEYCAKQGRTGLVGYKRHILALGERHGLGPPGKGQDTAWRKELSARLGYKVAWLGGLRGSNEMEGVDYLVLAGRQEVSVRSLEDQARCLFGDDPEPLALLPEPPNGQRAGYVEAWRGYRMADGRELYGRVSTHLDPRCQALLEGTREREQEQALDRARLVHRDKPAVIISLSSLPLDAEVHALVPRADVLVSREMRMLAKTGGINLLSPSERARLFPGLWRSENTAELELKRRKGGSNPSIIILLRGLTPLMPPKSLIYRRPGQKGSAHRALVPGGWCEAEARERLEGIPGMGRLASVRMEPAPEPPGASHPSTDTIDDATAPDTTTSAAESPSAEAATSTEGSGELVEPFVLPGVSTVVHTPHLVGVFVIGRRVYLIERAEPPARDRTQIGCNNNSHYAAA